MNRKNMLKYINPVIAILIVSQLLSALFSEAPRASARGISGKTKRNSAEATRLRPVGYAAVASRHSSPCSRTGHPGEGE
jgi:hypothetical protein